MLRVSLLEHTPLDGAEMLVSVDVPLDWLNVMVMDHLVIRVTEELILGGVLLEKPRWGVLDWQDMSIILD